MKKLITLTISITIFSIILKAQADSSYNQDFELLKNSEIFMNVMKILNTDYVYPVSNKSLINTAITSMLKKLDPYTTFYPEEQIQDYRLISESKYVGIGIIVQKLNSNFYVTKVLKNSPADNAGIKIGDQILEVNNINVKNKTLKQLHYLITGAPNTEVTLKIKHLTNKIQKITVSRQNIKLNPISNALIDKNIGYIKLEQFTENSYESFKKHFSQFNSQSIKGLIIDLRDNPGGLLNEAVDILSTLLPPKTTVVSVHGKNPKYDETFITTKSPINTEIPVVVLVNKNSASASEILAGTLQDLDRAVIIGTQTYGKGLVQSFFDVGYNSKLKVTIAKYYIPSGRCIQSYDYFSHKSTKEFPDSLLKKFYTKNGRIVYEGKGIIPDIQINLLKQNDFIQDLIDKNIISFFASYYIQTHLDDSITYFSNIDKFIEFLNNFGYSFKSKSRIKFEEFIATLDSSDAVAFEKYFTVIDKPLDKLVNENKDILIKLINHQILSILNLKTEAFEIRKSFDDQLNFAYRLLQDIQHYNLLLSPKN